MSRLRSRTFGRRGMTLVELVLAIVVVGIAVTGVLLVMNHTSARSVDPMLQHQAVAIAEAYLEEVLLNPYSDPDGVALVEADRTLYDDLDDYHGLSDVGARDLSNPALVIAGLEAYTVQVAVTAAVLNGVASKRVAVTVSHPSGINLTLGGYRSNY